MIQENFGFDHIYRHKKRTWSSFWAPVFVSVITVVVFLHTIASPVIFAALPGKTRRQNIFLRNKHTGPFGVLVSGYSIP